MRVRIRRDPDVTERWIVETKEFFFSLWQYAYSYSGDGSKECALETAELIANPEIIEFKKR